VPEPEPAEKAAEKAERKPLPAGARGDYSTLDVGALFEAHGLYGRCIDPAEGRHAVLCPWADEHTVKRPATYGDTVIWEARDGGWPRFHCSHKHCEGRRIEDVIALWPDADDFCAKEFTPQPRPDEAGQGEGRGGGRRSVATVLADLALAEGIELWHTPEKEQFATVWRDGHAEHWPLKSEAFTAWLAGLYYDRTTHIAKDSAVKDARLALMARANEGPPVRAYTRVAGHEGAIYLDLADDKWRAVRIDAKGWEVVSNPPVRFRRAPGQDALPVPEPGGTLDELRRFVNVSDAEWPLVAAWLLFALRPTPGARRRGSYPVLILGGTKGSAKSTTSSVLRRLIDPHEDEMQSVIRSDRELAIAAQDNWVFALDNVSVIQSWFSDALCRLATGLGYSTRALYTDKDRVVFSAKRPIILNGIGDFATASDLLDRALLITCPRIPEDARKTEDELEDEFEEEWPRLLGAALDCLCKTLAELPKVKLAGKPRMADFAVFATAAARAGVFDEETFRRAYGASQAAADAIALEGTPVAQAVFALLKATAGGVWEGTATKLLHALADHADETMRRSGAWPKTANWLSRELDKVADNLLARGVTVTRTTQHRGTKVIVLSRSGDAKPPCGDAIGDGGDAKPPCGDAIGDANMGPRSQSPRGFAPTGDDGDAKNRNLYPGYNVDPRGEKEEEAAEGARENPGVENSKNCVSSVSTDTAPADDQDPVDDEIDNCACGRPADRYTPDGEPFCNECGAPTADGKAGPQDPVDELWEEAGIDADERGAE
jgi:hypothetical protein